MLKFHAEWLFNENSGTTAEDTSPNSNHGSFSGAQWGVGKVGSGLSFDGVDDYVAIADNPSLDITGNLTVEAWVKPLDTSNWNTIVSRDEYGRRLLLAPNGNVQTDFGGTIQTTTTSPIKGGEWNHIVYTSNGTASTIYVNGVAVLSGNGGADFSSSNNVFIGKTIGGYYPFDGVIDKVALYQRTLSPCIRMC